MTSRHLIVYAEDDPDDLQFVREAFEQHDHIEILHARDGLIALDILNHLASNGMQPCLIILDINMPRLNGKETLQAIRQNVHLKDIPVVLFSTSSNPADHHFAQKWSSELVTKPLSKSDLDHIGKMFLDKCNFEAVKLR